MRLQQATKGRPQARYTRQCAPRCTAFHALHRLRRNRSRGTHRCRVTSELQYAHKRKKLYSLAPLMSRDLQRQEQARKRTSRAHTSSGSQGKSEVGPGGGADITFSLRRCSFMSNFMSDIPHTAAATCFPRQRQRKQLHVRYESSSENYTRLHTHAHSLSHTLTLNIRTRKQSVAPCVHEASF